MARDALFNLQFYRAVPDAGLFTDERYLDESGSLARFELFRPKTFFTLQNGIPQLLVEQAAVGREGPSAVRG